MEFIVAQSLKILLTVQDHDIRIKKLRQLLASVPQEKETIHHLLNNTEEMVNAEKSKLQEREKAIKYAEIEIDSLKDKLDNLKKKSSNIKKNEDYRIFLQESEQYQRQIREHEDQVLDHMEQLEGLQKDYQKAITKQKNVKIRVKTMLADLDLRCQNCSEKINEIRIKREQSFQNLPENLQQLYTRLIKPFEDSFRKVVVSIRDNNCGACFLSLTPSTKHKVKKGELISCENCSALLYLDDHIAPHH